MNFRQLVIRNVTRNGRAYAAYFLSSLFSVMVFFIFALLFSHPDFSQGLHGSSNFIGMLSTAGMIVAQVVIVLMSFVFLWYAFSVFLKSRKRDFSIYLILGMAKRDLKRMVFLENIILAISATFTGILLGTLFSKAFLLIAQNLLMIEKGMAFYLPLKPALLTLVVFGILFALLALLTTARLETEDLAEMTKSGDKPLPEPQTSWVLSLLSFVLLLSGYGAVFHFAFQIRSGTQTMMFMGLGWLLGGVLLTVLGTFLFFRQNTVAFFRLLKKSRLYFKEGQMLTISNLVYRMKNNSMMYFMIAIVAAVAFVAIGVTMALGGDEFARTQETNVAFMYQSDNSEEGRRYHQQNQHFIEETIEGAGYETLVQQLQPIWVEIAGMETGVSLLPASAYNQLAAFTGGKLLQPKDQELIFFPSTNTMVNQIKEGKLDQEEIQAEVLVNETATEAITYTYTTERYSFGYDSLALVTDTFYQRLKEQIEADFAKENNKPYPHTTTYVAHYLEWADDPAVGQKIISFLAEKVAANEAGWEEFFAETANDEGESSPEQLAQEEKLSREWFYYQSLYENWHQSKQSNGMILLISALIGSVFFTFAACIIYFRLFGELTEAGAYHRSLHILGVSQKIRHKIVTREMLLMYFIPVVIALVHFAVAMVSFSLLIELPIWSYFFQVSFSFILFQLLFFFISRWRYLRHLDFIAEKN